MERTDDKAGRGAGAASRQAERRKSLNLRRVPGPVKAAADASVRDALREQRVGLAGQGGIADGLQVARDLARQHLDEAGAEHANGDARVRNRLLSHRAAELVHRTLGRKKIQPVERCEIESLTEHEHIGHDVAVAARDAKGLAVAAGARVGLGGGEAVEVAREDQRIIRVRERHARGHRLPGWSSWP